MRALMWFVLGVVLIALTAVGMEYPRAAGVALFFLLGGALSVWLFGGLVRVGRGDAP